MNYYIITEAGPAHLYSGKVNGESAIERALRQCKSQGIKEVWPTANETKDGAKYEVEHIKSGKIDPHALHVFVDGEAMTDYDGELSTYTINKDNRVVWLRHNASPGYTIPELFKHWQLLDGTQSLAFV